MAARAARVGTAPYAGALSYGVDAAVAVTVVLVFWLPSLLAADPLPRRVTGGFLAALTVIAVLARWRFPVAAPAVALGTTLAGWTLGVGTDPALALAWALYPLAARRATRTRVLGPAVVGVVLLLCAAVAVPAGPSALGRRVVLGVAAVGACWLLGHTEGRRLASVRESEQARLAQERTRQQLATARDVHDVVGHTLAVISAEAAVTRTLPDADERELREGLADVERHARRALEEVQGLVRTLRPEPDGRGGPGARDVPSPPADVHDLLAAARAAGLDVAARVETGGVTPEVGAVAARLVQEALSNVIRHAGATACDVTLVRRDGGLEVRVADDGRGLTAADAPGFGLRGMRERAQEIGGTLTWRDRSGGGTEVTAWLPDGTATR